MAKNRRARRKEQRRKRSGTVPGVGAKRVAWAKAYVARRQAEALPRDIIDQDRAWYIVQTYPGREADVERVLLGDPNNADPRKRSPRRGITYRPREIVRRGRRGKPYNSFRHLMPRSMFFGCDRGLDPRTLLEDIDGFYGLLRRTDGLIVRISALELQRFADVVSDELAPLAGAGNTVLKSGDEVTLNSGPFVGFRGVIIRPAKGGFVRLSITLLESEHEFTAPIDGLLAA